MNTKHYTSIEQSKKLLELGLSPETADMWYQHTGISIKDGSKKPIYFPMVIRDCESDEDIPCWSLSALLDILAEQDFIVKSVVYSNEYQYNIDIPSRHCKIWFSSLLDAAFEMICWLKENNKL